MSKMIPKDEAKNLEVVAPRPARRTQGVRGLKPPWGEYRRPPLVLGVLLQASMTMAVADKFLSNYCLAICRAAVHTETQTTTKN